MKRLLGEYGRVILITVIAGGLLLFLIGTYGKKLQTQFVIKEKEVADNISEEQIYLAEHGYVPYFTGVEHVTVSKEFRGMNGEIGFTKEDALAGVKAYEYRYANQELVVQEIPVENILVYPFDEPEDATQDSGREEIDVNHTGRYSLRYVVEGSTGLKAETTRILLVDFLPDGVSRR